MNWKNGDFRSENLEVANRWRTGTPWYASFPLPTQVILITYAIHEIKNDSIAPSIKYDVWYGMNFERGIFFENDHLFEYMSDFGQ